MKLKFLQFEYDFDKDDARIVIPLILLLLALGFTPLNKELLLAGTAAYYLLYFFLRICLENVSKFLARKSFKCPYCKSREMLFADVLFLKGGVAGYDSYICNACGRVSIHINNALISKLVKTDPAKQLR
jgi:DNA-directed RNA polymerase subunit RPC12/RpoP